MTPVKLNQSLQSAEMQMLVQTHSWAGFMHEVLGKDLDGGKTKTGGNKWEDKGG